MALNLTEMEKEKIRYHLGYMETTYGGGTAAASISFGVPRPSQTIFLLEEAIQQLLRNPYAIERVRRVLATLENLETQIEGAACTLVAQRLGEMTLHPGRERGHYYPDLLEKEYKRWAFRLADILGVPVYPYSKRFSTGGGGPGSVVPVR